MVAIHRRPGWAIPESEATPEQVFLNRRSLLKGFGLGAASAAALSILPPRARADETGPTAGLYPAARNDAYKVDRDLTPEDIAAKYNNFYEFGSQKYIAPQAQNLVIRPWEIAIDGMVEKPQKIQCDALIRSMPLEERVYRHRCVEAWSMTVPWTGFPLAKLVEMAKPLSSAKYVRLETFLDPSMASGQKQIWYPWPYVEGVTMAEATNELAFLVTGVYGKPLPKQHGAPLRLVLPWKYGFKSVKSIRRITFADQRPKTFWAEIAPDEYGFWANVNPDVPHPRWSQKTERLLATGKEVPTRLFNGYGDFVAGLYADLQDDRLFM